MEASSDVLASLEARAEERSLSDLEKRGRTKLRVIRKREIAALVQEAVDRAIASSEWVPPEKLDELRKRSEREFSDLKTEWESERGEHARLETELGQERERNQELEDVAAGLREELDEAQQRIAELEELTEGAASESQGGAAMSLGGDATSAMLMMKMMEEIQALKSQAQTPAPAPTGEDPGIASKLDQLVSGSMPSSRPLARRWASARPSIARKWITPGSSRRTAPTTSRPIWATSRSSSAREAALRPTSSA
jgi:hypothetical protein